MKVLLYLLYGTRASYWRECKFSILSALRHLNRESDDQIKIVLATDQSSELEGWPVEIHPIEQATLQGWAGPDNYFHRSKNRVMAEVMDRFQVPTVFVDTDTYFVQSPRHLFERVLPGQSVMHLPEGKIVEAHKELASYAVDRPLEDPDGGTFMITADSQMFNSGIVGLHPQDRPLLDRALWLVDQLYGPTRVFNVEQYALGEVLQRHTELHMSGDIVHHYWGFSRAFFHRDMRMFFERYASLSVAELAEHTDEIQAQIPKNSLIERVYERAMRELGIWSKSYGAAFLAAKQVQNYVPPKLDEPELASIWRNQAKALLLEDLLKLKQSTDVQAFKKRLDQVFKAAFWKPLRDPAAIEQLPKEERDVWKTLWQDLQQQHQSLSAE